MAELFGPEAGSVGTQMKCLLSPTLDSKALLGWAQAPRGKHQAYKDAYNNRDKNSLQANHGFPQKVSSHEGKPRACLYIV